MTADELAGRRAAAAEGLEQLLAAAAVVDPLPVPPRPERGSATLRVLPDLVQGTDEWHDQRRGMITASVVGRLLTVRAMAAIEYLCPAPACGAGPGDPCLSKVKRGGETGAPIKVPHPERAAVAAERRADSPPVVEVATGDDAQNLTALLAAERITGHTDPTYVSDDMLRGIEDQVRAVDKYAEHYAPVRHVGFMVRSWDGCQLGFSPDGLVGDDGLVEVKSRRAKKQLVTVLDGAAPVENMAQMQAGLLVSGRAWCDYVSYSGGMHLWRTRIYPDQRWFDVILAAVELFETTAADMVSRYNAATEGLPMTERTVELEMIL